MSRFFCTHTSIIILGCVFLLIAVRQIGSFRFRIWQVMLAGATAVLLSGGIGIDEAVRAVQPDIMIFLFGMFVIGEAVLESGYLEKITCSISRRCRTKDQMLLVFIVVMGGASAILMNDTVAIIGSPLALSLAARYKIPPAVLLLTLCYALTTGSVPSPIGNPQNLLVASYWNPSDPFQVFFCGLIIPTLISLILVWFCMRGRCKQGGSQELPDAAGSSRMSHMHNDYPPDRRLVLATRISGIILSIMVLVRIIAPSDGDLGSFPLGYIALAAAVPILVISRERVRLLTRVDWRTLIFFASMFVLMQSVYDSGWFQESVPFSSMTSVPMILSLGIILSQFISNVPFIALFQPVIINSGLSPEGILALAAGSTIAGNLTILGAASNVIVLEQAEKFGIRISFREFCTAGIPLTLMQGIVYIVWLTIW